MQNFITSTLKLGRKLSMVLWLIDQYTSLGSNEEISVCLNGLPAGFQRKAGGYLVFTDLEEDRYRISLESPYYCPEELEVHLSSLDRSEPVVYVPLKPAPAYRFNPGSTLIRASLCAKDGGPASGNITAILGSENCARAQLGRQGAKAGSTEISLVEVTGRLAPGDLLLIRSRGAKKGEICEITTMGGGEGVYSLKKPLSSDHKRGELLMPLVTARSDQRGEIVVGIRSLRQKTCQLELEISAGANSQTLEIEIKAGQTHYLGKVALQK